MSPRSRQAPRPQSRRRLPLRALLLRLLLVGGLLCLIAQALELDVALGLGRGEVTGWVQPRERRTQSPDIKGMRFRIFQTLVVDDPLETGGDRVVFQVIAPGTFDRIQHACYVHGVERVHAPEPAGGTSAQIGPAPAPSGRWVYGRVYFAGLLRRVACGFKELPPDR